MEIRIFKQIQVDLQFQRNVLAVVCALTLLTNIIFGVCLLRNEKLTYILPPHIDREIVLSNKRVDSSYIEGMTVYYLNLLLGLTYENFDYQTSLVLRDIHPTFYPQIKKFFDEEKKRYKDFRLSTYFKLKELIPAKNNLAVLVKGVLISYFGDGGKSEDKVTYHIEYDYNIGKLTIKDFSIIKEKEKEDKNA